MNKSLSRIFCTAVLVAITLGGVGFVHADPQRPKGETPLLTPRQPVPARQDVTPTLPAAGQSPSAANPSAGGLPSVETQAFQKFITSTILEQIPHDYEDNKNWGTKAKRISGVYVKLDGAKLDTHREFTEVNHGTWTSYRVELVDPEKKFQLDLENLRRIDDGRVAFDLVVNTPLHCTGRLSQWEKGVQLISLDADATADVRLKISGTLRTKLELVGFSPEVTLDPKITDARLELIDFHVHRVSKLGGTLSEQLGKNIRHSVETKLADYQPKLVEKLNQQIDKHRDRLRFSFGDLAKSPWASWTKFVTGSQQQ